MRRFTGNTRPAGVMAAALAAAARSRAGRPTSSSAAVAVLGAAQFVVVLDATIVATALPAIGSDLGFRPAQLSWVITAYTVVLAGLLILGGRTADLLGPRRMFAAGLAVFALASAACATAWSPAILIAARVAQGCGAALLSPAALAALNTVVRDPAAQRRALGWWTAAGAGGGASGWVLGGLITELAGWRWVFAVNVPIGLISLPLIALLLPATPHRNHSRRTAPLQGTDTTTPTRQHAHHLPAAGPEQADLETAATRWEARHDPTVGLGRAGLDLGGAVLVTAGIAVGVVGLSWLSGDIAAPAGWVATVLAAVLVAGFARRERHTQRPLVPGSLLRVPGVLGGNLTAAALTGSTTPAMLTAVLYVQDTLRLSPARGALLFPAFNLAVIAGSLLGPRTLGGFGPRRTLVAGFSLVVTGAALMITLPRQGLPVVTLLGTFAVMGLGLGAASVASTASGTAEVPDPDRGVAAGLLNSSAQLGTALGLALTGPLVASAAPMLGYRLGFATAALIAIAGAISSLSSVAGARVDAGAALDVPASISPAPSQPDSEGKPRSAGNTPTNSGLDRPGSR